MRPASDTQKTPSGRFPTSSAATCSARRVLPVPPGPVTVSRRVPFGEQRDELLELALAADERDRDDGQVGGVERPEGREVALSELEEALCADQVLEAVLAEVADRSVGRRGGYASSRRRRSGRRARRPRCALLGGRLCRRSPRRSRAARRCGRPSGPGSARPRAPPAPRPRLRRRRPPPGTRRRTRRPACPPRRRRAVRRPRGSRCRCSARRSAYAVPVLLKQTRRPLDVGEEERDRAGRQRTPVHGARLRWIA